MKIDARIEPLVREVLDAAVKKDLNRLEAALAALGDGEDAAFAIRLASAICLYVLLDLHDGNQPTAEQINALAQEIARDESWASVNIREVSALLTNLFGLDLSTGLPAEEAVTLPFIVAANLLAASTEPKDGNRWFDYLDEIEDRLEAANG